MTGQALLTRCFQNIGILAPGEVLNADDAAVGLGDLQNFLDSLGVKALTMFAHARNVLPLTSGQQTYTIGSGGNLNVARPQFIDDVKCLRTTGSTTIETPVAILTERQYANIPVKAITTAIISAIFYDYGWTAGLGQIVVYPYPSVSGLSLVLYGPVAVTNFSDLVTNVTFPPGYAEAIEYNVSKRLTVKYPKGQVSPLLMSLADSSLQALLSSNFRPEELQLDPVLGRQGRGLGNSYYGVLGGWS